MPTGTWQGTLGEGEFAYPVFVTFADCSEVGVECGEIEYTDPAQPDSILCAPLLVYRGPDGDGVLFEEQPAYKPDQCFPTTLRMTFSDPSTLVVEQFVDPEDVFAEGTLTQVSATAEPTPLPESPALPGFDSSPAAIDLGGYTTQYVADAAGAAWFPIGGAVLRIDDEPSVEQTIVAGEPGSVDDPHSVAGNDEALWVAQAADQSVARIDPATNTIEEVIDVGSAPYALALDGDDLWVTSFEDDTVVRIDASTGETVASIAVPSPTGVASSDGAVWVVEHRDDSIARIDPATNEIVETIGLGSTGDDPTCGMCVENVIFADGSIWTANNAGRSITRIDPDTNEIQVIELEMRAWAVTAGGGAVWASQFEDNDGALDPSTGGVARIDPATNTAEQLSVPGAQSVTWAQDALWVVVPGRRSDLVYRYLPAT